MKINPDLYHGHDQYTNFFEGWYFKIVDATATYALDRKSTRLNSSHL